MKLYPVNLLQASTIVLLSITLSTSSPLEKRGPVCREIVVPVTITCDNSVRTRPYSIISSKRPVSDKNADRSLHQIISPTLDLGSQVGLLSSVVGLFFGLTVLGTYDIRGTYCEPEVNIPSRSNTLQLLAHPATYDRNYVSLYH
jgi:hypothetical protein